MDIRGYIQGAIGGTVTGLVILAGFIIARANADGASPGDWLNFAGVIVGVGLTMVGTIGIQRWSEREKLKPHRKRMLFLVEHLEASINDLVQTGDPGAVSANIVGVGQANDEIRAMDFDLVRDIHLLVIEFEKALASTLSVTPAGKMLAGPSAQRQAGVDEMHRVIGLMKKRVR